MFLTTFNSETTTKFYWWIQDSCINATHAVRVAKRVLVVSRWNVLPINKNYIQLRIGMFLLLKPQHKWNWMVQVKWPQMYYTLIAGLGAGVAWVIPPSRSYTWGISKFLPESTHCGYNPIADLVPAIGSCQGHFTYMYVCTNLWPRLSRSYRMCNCRKHPATP